MPLDPVEHAELIQRLRKLGEGKKWIFQNRAGSPIDHNNGRWRYLKPAAAAVGVHIGGRSAHRRLARFPSHFVARPCSVLALTQS